MKNVTKRCSKCNGLLNASDFHINQAKKSGRSYYCKECNKEYLKGHYILNKEYYKQKNKERRAAIRKWYNEYKSNLKCEKCGENHPACLEFHHKDSDIKDKEISKMVSCGVSPDKILKEISKCSVLCSNCHRKLHYNDRGSSSGLRHRTLNPVIEGSNPSPRARKDFCSFKSYSR